MKQSLRIALTIIGGLLLTISGIILSRWIYEDNTLSLLGFIPVAIGYLMIVIARESEVTENV